MLKDKALQCNVSMQQNLELIQYLTGGINETNTLNVSKNGLS